MIKVLKVFYFFFLVSLLFNCSSSQKQLIGTWKLVEVINDDNSYVGRSSLTSQKIESNTTLTLKKDGTFVSNANYCFDGIKRDNSSSGRYFMKKYNRIDKTYTFESANCPGIGSDLRFKIRDKKLELDLPTVQGYRIQIFEKVNSK
jgi:hypothetical protein